MDATKWYVRNTAGKVFGPIDIETLKRWVCEGRVEPLAGVSSDLSNWMVAPQMPELEMNWVVENNAGQFYGPTHRAVLDDLVKAGTLSPSARFFLDDRGAAEERIRALEEALAASEQQRADCEAEVSALKELLSKATEVHEREWRTEVVVPEVVANEPPPPMARQAFAPSSQASLVELERRAQQELARMGPSGVKRLFRLKK